MSTDVQVFEPGIYYDIPADVYHAAPGLSNSGMKDLAISPLRYWHLHINPQRPAKEETSFMEIGTALHCAVLEPARFEAQYAREITAADYDGCLVTMEDMRAWCAGQGLSFTARTKAEMVTIVQKFCASQSVPVPPILDVLRADYAQATQGMIQLSSDAWRAVTGAASALRNEPSLASILESGNAEVSIFARDPETGVLLKSRNDWINGPVTLDLKTFSQKRGKSIDKSIGDAIFYEGYHKQAYFYTLLRSLHGVKGQKFVMGFVESDDPHEVRIREFKPVAHGEANVYWEHARLETRSLINAYAHYRQRYGNDPWRETQAIEILRDEELPTFAY